MPDLIDQQGDQPPLRQRLALLAINGLLFQALYAACNLAAARAGVTRNIATAWDASVPFLPWMLVPYMTSVPLLVLAFLRTPGRQSLRALSQRCLLATALGTLVFALWPLHMNAAAPVSQTPALAWLGEALKQLDAPYNQWPSLHVAYCVILWPALGCIWTGTAARLAWLVWLGIVSASTVFTHQHYLPDLAGGAALGAFALWAVPAQRHVPWVSLHYAVSALAATTLGLTVLPLAPCLWIAACCGAVALSYARRDQNFLHKRDGAFPIWVCVLYAPYLLGYWLTWHVVRRRERGRAPFSQFAERLWIGRRLDDREAMALPPNCVVIDLAAELCETQALRGHVVHTFGMLDLVAPSPDELARIVDVIDAELARGHDVFVHCSMGYRRSREVALAWRVRRSTIVS
jgi:membrane-associated phospholipid phosphatase